MSVMLSAYRKNPNPENCAANDKKGTVEFRKGGDVKDEGEGAYRQKEHLGEELSAAGGKGSTSATESGEETLFQKSRGALKPVLRP